jgi:hypothetical protein
MANFTVVNKAIKAAYPLLDIEAVRGNGYVYFDSDNGFDNIPSIMIHPTATKTEDMIRVVLESIEQTL